MVSVTDGPCLRLVIFPRNSMQKQFFFQILIKIKMTSIWTFQLLQCTVYNFFFIVLLDFSLIDKQDISVGGPFSELRFWCLFIFIVFTSFIYSQGRTQPLGSTNHWRMLFVVCFTGLPCQRERCPNVLHDTHLFPINFTGSSLVIVKSQFSVLFVTLIDVPEWICFHRTALGLKHHNFHWL